MISKTSSVHSSSWKECRKNGKSLCYWEALDSTNVQPVAESTEYMQAFSSYTYAISIVRLAEEFRIVAYWLSMIFSSDDDSSTKNDVFLWRFKLMIKPAYPVNSLPYIFCVIPKKNCSSSFMIPYEVLVGTSGWITSFYASTLIIVWEVPSEKLS